MEDNKNKDQVADEQKAADEKATQEAKDKEAAGNKDDDEKHDAAVEASKEFDAKMDEEDTKTPAGDEKEPAADKKPGEGDDAAKKTAEEDNARKEVEKKAAEQKAADEKAAAEKGDEGASDELLERAVRVGFDLATARSFGSPADLEKTVGILESKTAAAGDQTDDDKTGKKAESKDKDKEDKAPELKPFEMKFENADEIDPEILKNIKGMNTHYAEQLKKMQEHHSGVVKSLKDEAEKAKAEVGTIKSTNNQAAAKSLETQIDSAVSELGDDYKELLGEGKNADLKKDSVGRQNRNKIVNTMTIITNQYITEKKAVPSVKEIFNHAIKVVFSDKVIELEKSKMVKQVVKRGGQLINKPGAKDKSSVKGHDAAVEASKEFDAKMDEED